MALWGSMAALDQSRENGQAGSPAPTVAINIGPVTGSVLYVRLWTRREAGQPARAGQESTDPAVCLTTDLLRASGADPVETDGRVCVARFSTLQAGILAARRLQWAAQGFSESENPVETAIAVLVQQAEDSPDALAGGPYPAVLERAAPGQILMTNNVGKDLEEMAGFSLGGSLGNRVPGIDVARAGSTLDPFHRRNGD